MSRVFSNHKLNLFACFIVFFATQLILSFYLRDAFWHPSKYVYTYGGDGAFVYFNMIYHSLFGSGLMLTNMNFPNFESLFMTDSQASVGLFLSIINDLFPNYLTPEKIIGLSHRFHYLMLGIGGIYLFKSLSILKINRIIAIPASILIILLSPLMIRLTAGHFGLAYPFVFAFVIYFLLQYYQDRKIKIWPFVGLFFTLLYFGLNNFYIGIINISILALVSIYFVFSQNYRIKSTILLGYSIGMVIILYGFIFFTDPGADRISIQWGYYTNSVDLGSFIFPHTSLLNKIVSKFSEIKNFGGETWVNLGLIPVLLLISATLFYFIKTEKQRVINPNKLIFKSFIFASFILLIYSSALLYRVPFFQDTFFHKFGILTMFKASGRFSWPIYFFATLAATFYLQKWSDFLHQKSKTIATIFMVSTIGIWGLETHLYLKDFVFAQLHSNPYNSSKKAEVLSTFKQNKIDFKQFQALYSVPVMEGWNDKFQIVPHFNSEFNSILISMATGLPMVNGMLSRIGITDASRAIQLSSNPLIEKALVSTLDAEKPLLLVLGNGAEKLTLGEEFLINKGTFLAETNDYKLFSIYPNEINNYPVRDSILKKYDLGIDTTFETQNSFYIYKSFDELPSPSSFAGNGAMEFSENLELINEELPLNVSGDFECSIYVKLDHKMYGMPNFTLKLLGVNNEEIWADSFSPTQSKDNQDSWVRVSKNFNINEQMKSIKIDISGVNQNFLIDELCIRKIESTLIKLNNARNELLFNNFKLNNHKNKN